MGSAVSGGLLGACHVQIAENEGGRERERALYFLPPGLAALRVVPEEDHATHFLHDPLTHARDLGWLVAVWDMGALPGLALLKSCEYVLHENILLACNIGYFWQMFAGEFTVNESLRKI